MRIILLALIRAWQWGVSPLAKLLVPAPPMGGRCCRFHPTCSAYAYTAIARFGAWRGLTLAGHRLARCHPWAAGGDDPVPEQTA